MARCAMPTTTRRKVFEAGHRRKILVIADESKEVEPALFYAACRSEHTNGGVVLLYVIEPDNQFWGGVRQVQIEEETNKAKAVFRLLRLKLSKEGFDKVRCERHEKMFEKCGSIKGPAHHQCDRDFLVANPADCSKLSDKAAAACNAENRAFKNCESNQGTAFMQCVKKETGDSPMGH